MLQNFILLTPTTKIWLRSILNLILLLVIVSAIFFLVQYNTNGWPFKTKEVVNDRSFQVENSSVENLLANGNERQLWAKVYDIADQPEQSDTERMAFLRDRINLLQRIQELNPEDDNAKTELIASLCLTEKFCVQFDSDSSTRNDLEKIAKANVSKGDLALTEQALTGLAVARVAYFVDRAGQQEPELGELLDQLDELHGKNSTNVQLIKTLGQWCELLDDKLDPESSRKFKEWLIGKSMLSSVASIREVGISLSKSLEQVNLAMISANEYSLSRRKEIATAFGVFLEDAAKNAAKPLTIEQVLQQAEQQLMLGKFGTSERNFQRLKELADGPWAEFQEPIAGVLKLYSNLNQEFDESIFLTREGIPATFNTDKASEYRLVFLVSADSYAESTKRFAEIINSFSRSHWRDGKVQFAIVFLDTGNQSALEKFWTNPAVEVGLNSWKLDVAGEEGKSFLSRFPFSKMPQLMVLGKGNKIRSFDPQKAILNEMRYSIKYGEQ